MKRARWQVGDLVLDGGTRWVIFGITASGTVGLKAANAMNAIHWKTTLDKLPEKTA